MDRALKERIIGAIVLVVAVVVVVPVFLDGPSDDAEIISESINLPGQANDGTRTIVLDRDRSEPVPQTPAQSPAVEPEGATTPQSTIASAPVESEPEPVEEPVATASEPEPAPETRPERTEAPAAAPAVASRSSTGMWAVQLGSFSNQGNAERLAADLRQQGFAAFLSDVSTDDGVLHRVRIGPQKDRESAEVMAARLGRAGHKGQVVPHP